jgi:ribosome-associated toxin RatA of RatAB toxin-antitoxin module
MLEGEYVVCRATLAVRASRERVWKVLTDYERYPRFLPDIEISRVAYRGPEGLVLEQRGTVGLLFVSRTIEVRLGALETAPHSLQLRLLSGNLRDMQGRYDLHEQGGMTRMVYQGRFLAEADLPPFMALAMVRHALTRQLGGLVAEMERDDSGRRRGVP